MIVNPGGVGLPAYEEDNPFPHRVQTGSPHARYAILEQTSHGWEIEMIAVEYDWRRAAAAAEHRGRPDWARALATGLV